MPIAPVRGIDLYLSVAVSIDPSAHGSAARIPQRMHSTAIYHSEFKIKLERRTGDELPHCCHMVRWRRPRKSPSGLICIAPA
jgi:hypothetical protein